MTNTRTLIIHIFCLLLLLTISGISHNFAFANESALSGIIHFPIKNAHEGQQIFIEAKIEDPNIHMEYMRLYYRIKGGANFQYLEMQDQMNSYVGEIPSSEVKIPGVEYFIMGVLKNRSMITSPENNPYYAPYEIIVTPGSVSNIDSARHAPPKVKKSLSSKSGSRIEAVILSPEPDEDISKDEVIIALSFLGEVDRLKMKSIRLFIDDKNVTGQAEITRNMISYVPKNLSSGKHQVKVQFADNDGNRFDDMIWNFSVIPEREAARKEKSAPISGSAFAEWKNENFSDSTLTSQNVGANFRGKYGPVEYRGLAFFTSREKPEFQTRNRFLLEVGTSWIGVKLGDTSPRFNELMLWGMRVRGIEAYLKFGFINFEFVQGETNRRVKGIPYGVTVDPITGLIKYVMPNTNIPVNSTTGIYRYGTFKQSLLSGRLSFGGGRNFQLGFNFVKVKDDTSSSTYGIHPKDNLVIGPDILFAIDNHRIELKASAAFSLLANDISNGAISKSELDSSIGDIPFDPSDYEQYFILNTSLIPLDPSQLTSLAYQGSFKFNYFNNNIQVLYKTIGSEYNSLANTFLRRDIQGFSISDRIRLYQNQIYLNLGYDKYVEGLSYEIDGEATTAPTQFDALSIGISLYPREKYLPKINVNWKNYNRDDGLDTTLAPNAVNYENKDISVQLGYDVQLFNLNHTFSVGYITADRVDGFKRTYTNLANDLRMFSIRTVYQFPMTTNISYATNQNDAAGGMSAFKYSMFSLSADYNLLERRLNLRGGLNMTSAVGTFTTYYDSLGNQLTTPMTSDYTDYKRTAINLGGSFQITRQHSLLLDMSFIDFNDKVKKTYNDSMIRLRYEFQY